MKLQKITLFFLENSFVLIPSYYLWTVLGLRPRSAEKKLPSFM
ncbi:MAG: hypothetical protein QE493_07385 [Verrucomicrobiae bacterium]|nr:hypothetical protein [Verrucomicrobiae bacterium]